ncbi:alpha/beta hydrolases superfamily protein [Tanacetum coccineum]
MKCFRCEDPNHLIGECPKPPRDKNKRLFSEVLGVISVRKMMKRLKTKCVSWLKHLVRQPRIDKKTFQRSRDDKNGKSDKKCVRCGDPIHLLIVECPKLPKEKNQRAFNGGSWSDSGEEDDIEHKDCNTPKMGRSGICCSKGITSYINSTRYENDL